MRVVFIFSIVLDSMVGELYGIRVLGFFKVFISMSIYISFIFYVVIN